jgi:hypothetical protein
MPALPLRIADDLSLPLDAATQTFAPARAPAHPWLDRIPESPGGGEPGALLGGLTDHV